MSQKTQYQHITEGIKSIYNQMKINYPDAEQIDDLSHPGYHRLDEASFGYEEGIILTYNQAQAIADYLFSIAKNQES